MTNVIVIMMAIMKTDTSLCSISYVIFTFRTVWYLSKHIICKRPRHQKNHCGDLALFRRKGEPKQTYGTFELAPPLNLKYVSFLLYPKRKAAHLGSNSLPDGPATTI